MFASQVPDYLDDDLLGTDATHAESNFNPDHTLYRRIQRLSRLTRQHDALRDGAHQHRYATDAAGIYAFSRIDRRDQREYVVVLNNSEERQTARVPTYNPRAPLPQGLRPGRRADVGGSSFYEVTFEARVGQGDWRSVGADDTAPYQVFHDVNEMRPGTRVDYRATVLAAAVTLGRARSAVPGSRRRSLAAGHGHRVPRDAARRRHPTVYTSEPSVP